MSGDQDMNKAKRIKESAQIYCVVYTIATLISSGLQIFQGYSTDMNAHILYRGWVVLIGVLTLQMIRYIAFKNKIVSIALPYAVSMGLVFLSTWISGFFEELHPDAYRDIFLNYTIGFIVVLAAVKGYAYTKQTRKGRSA